MVFEDVEEPTITDDTITIPEKCKYVVDIGQYMEIDYLQYAPGALAEGAAVSITYSKMAFVANTIAEYIRMMGYTAIPTGNDLALTIPNCIDGGLGQLGRLGLMITPEYGPSVRPCKIFTDMPLEPDSPIDFNVTPFCKVCKKCARECPAACIPFDERTDGYTPNDVGAPFVQSDGKAFYGRGTLKWYTHHEKDNKWWSEIGSGCAMCIAVCPYTKKPGFWSHDMAKWLIENVPSLDSLFVWTDDFLGYGRTLLNSEVARKRAVDYWKKKPPRATYKPFRW